MEHIYDTVVIGGGPAGYTAALYAARAGLDTVVLEKLAAGGQMALTGDIENYPGFDEGIDGFTLGMRMQAGAERFGAKTAYAEVLSVNLTGEIKTLETSDGSFRARTVIIATGADPRALGINGESELVGRGVHYCAHCDGRFYKDKTVMVVGGGNSAVSDALYLSRIAKKVIVVHRSDTFRAARINREALMKVENVELCLNSTVSDFLVDGKVVGAVLTDTKTGKRTEVRCDGIFISIGRIPATELFRGQLQTDDSGYLVADESTKTAVAGVFAVGDVRTKILRQVITAAADGAVAAHCAEEYLH